MQACMSIKNGSQDQGQVLRWFGQKQGDAEKACAVYVAEGIDLGRRREFAGGGLIGSLGSKLTLTSKI